MIETFLRDFVRIVHSGHVDYFEIAFWRAADADRPNCWTISVSKGRNNSMLSIKEGEPWPTVDEFLNGIDWYRQAKLDEANRLTGLSE